jgi:hypothetical protein
VLCVLFERSGNRNCHKAVLSEVGYICQVLKSNTWIIFFNIKYPSLLSEEQPVLMAARDDSKKLPCNISALN